MSKNTKTVILLLIAAVLIAAVPLFARKGAEFGGSDDAGSVMIEEIQGEYTPWFTPGAGERAGRGDPGRSGKPDLLCADRDRRGNHRFLYGKVCRAQEMDERRRRR